MSRLGNLFDAHAGAAQRKQLRIQQAAKEKQDYFDPEFKFNVADVGIVDADTIDLPSGERVRLSAGEGYALDSYETNPQTYEDRPGKEAAHKKSYAEAFGLDIDDVTREDLIIAGESQKAKFRDRLLQSADADGNISFRKRGIGQDNRIIGELDRDQINLSGRGDNAGYEGKYNFLQQLEDFSSGATAEHQAGSGDRSLTTLAKDQGVNLGIGAARMVNDLVQGAGVLAGVNKIPGVDEAHHIAREGLETLKEKFGSPQQQRRERLEQERNALQSEYYNVQEKKYRESGSNPINAAIRAGIDEFTNSVGNIIDNPGAILDKTVESLPYMLGVASVGRVAVNQSVKALQKQILTKAGSKSELRKHGTKFRKQADIDASTAQRTADFLKTRKGKEYVNKVATKTGIATVGLTEGLSTSAEVYDSIRNMTETEALNSDAYVQMRDSGMSHDQAVTKLAEDAHFQTLLSVTLAAGVAAAGTGAGAFEGQLFSGLTGVRKGVVKAAVKKPVKSGLIRSPVRGTAKAVKAVTKFAGPAGLKEASEELLQSGGGEFLSQLASFEATGKKVGPGVGAAAGEGAVVGFASGAGAQVVFGGLKKLGTADPRKIARAGQKWKEGRKPQPVSAVSPKEAPGAVPASVEEALDTQTPVEGQTEEQGPSFDDRFQTILDNLEKDTSASSVAGFKALNDLSKSAAAVGQPLSEANEERLKILRDWAAEDMTATMETISAKKSEDLDANDISNLALAGEMGIEVDTSKLSADQKEIYDTSTEVTAAFNELEVNREKQVENAPKKAGNIRRVWNEKFGNGRTLVKTKKNPEGTMRPGLGWYVRKMREGMNSQSFTTEDEGLNSLFSGLKNFRQSQGTYLKNAREAVRQRANVGTFTYVEPNAEKGVAGSPALLEILEAEDIEMQQIVDELGARYEAWKSASTPKIKSAVSKKGKPAAQAAPEGAPAPQQTTESASQPKQSKALRSQLKALEAELGTPELANKLRKFIKRAQKSADRGVIRSAIALNRKNNATVKTTRIEKGQAKKATETAETTGTTETTGTADQEKINTYVDKRAEELDNLTSTQIINIAKEMQIVTALTTTNPDDIDIGALMSEIIEVELEQQGFPDAKFAEAFQGTSISGAVGGEGSPAPATQPAAAAVAEGPKSVLEAGKEGFQSALDYIIANSKTPGVPAIATLLKKQLVGRKIPIVHLTQMQMLAKFNNDRAKAAWYKGTIYLNTTKLNTPARYQNSLMHELIHAGVDGWLDKNQDSKEFKELVALNREIRLALLADGGKFAIAMAKILAGNKQNPKGGIEELITHGMTTPFLQNFLQNMQVEDTTAWSKFVELIAKILGLENNTALHRVVSLTERVFEQANPGAPVEVVEESDTAAEAGAQAQPEQAAEGVDPAIQEQVEKTDRAIRLSELRRMETLLASGSITEGDIYLSNSEDLEFLNNLLERGVPQAQAIEQLQTEIEPNPEARNIKIDTAIDQETIDQVSANAAILNDRENKTELDARGIPDRWRDFRNLIDGAVTKMTKLFEKFNLPLKLSDAFTTQRSKVRDLLASDDFVMAVLTDPGAREQFFDKIGAKPAEQRALIAFSQFYEVFYRKLDESIRKVQAGDISKQKIGGHGIGAIDANLLPYFMDENDNLDANVVAAMALESMQWLTTRGAQTVSNSEDDVRAMFGLNDADFITRDMWTAAGQGTIRTAVTQEIGYKSLSHVNLKAKPDAKPLIREKLALSMGAQAVMTMAAIKRDGEPLIKMHAVERDHWNNMSGTEGSSEDSGTAANSGPVILIRNNSVDTVQDPVTLLFPRVDVNAPLRDAIEDGRGIFTNLFGSTSNVRTPVFEKPENGSVPTNVSRSMSKIPNLMRERMLTDMQKHYEMDVELLDLIERFDPQRFLEMAHGFTTEAEMENKHITERKGLEGKNLGLVRDLQEALHWKGRYGSKIFYLPQKMIRSGRVYIDSNVINPQASKLHRFMFVRDGWRRDITKREPSTLLGTERTQYVDFISAIGLGIGIKTEDYSRAEVVRQVEAYFAEGGEGKTALDVLAKNEAFTDDDYVVLERVISKEGTHSLAALNAYGKWAAASPGDKVSIAIPNESDGVTNGYIMGLMQTPPAEITPAYKKLMNAGGIFFKGDPWTSWAEYRADGGLDNYQYVAQGVRKALNAFKTNADAFVFKADTKKGVKRTVYLRQQIARVWSSGIVPDMKELDAGHKEGRDWAKNPLMVTSYGAGIPSVIRAMISSATEKFYENLAKARNGSPEDIANALNSVYGLANLWVDVNKRANIQKKVWINGQETWVDYERVGTQSDTGYITAEEVQAVADSHYGGDLRLLATTFILPREVEGYFGRSLAGTYGAALGESLDERLAPVLEIRKLMNGANKISNVLYSHDFARRVAALENDTGNRLTPQDRQAIREQMMKEGLVPTIGTAASEGLEDALETTNYENDYYKVGNKLQGGYGLVEDWTQFTEVEYGPNNTSRIPDKARSLSARITAPQPNSDVGVAAGVIGTHALDGVNNSAAWGQETYAVGNVHDAQLSPWWAASDVAGIANADFGTTNAGYAMPDQFLGTVLRMTASLLHPNDSRLTVARKQLVALEMLEYHQSAFGAVQIDWEAIGVNPKDDPVTAGRIVISRMVEELQRQVIASAEGKAVLYKDIRVISQYAMAGAEAVFPEGLELDKTNDDWYLKEPLTSVDLISTMRDYLNDGKPIHEQAIAWFKGILADEDADVGAAFISYIQHPSTDVSSTLDMLQAAYADTPLGQQLKVLNNVLQPYVSGIHTVKVSEGIEFVDRTRTIHIPADAQNPIAAFMNGLMYAAAMPRLQEMKRENPKEYAELGKHAFDRAKQMIRSDNGSVVRVGREILRYKQLSDTNAGLASFDHMIATFLGRTLSAPKAKGLNNYSLFFANTPAAFETYTANLQKALRAGQASTTVMFDEAFNDEDIHERYTVLLESEKVSKIFEDLALLEQTAEDPAHQAHLVELVDQLVVPGLTSIAPILQRVVVDNESTTNTGETIQEVGIEGDIIRLQAAGNATTNNVDSSLQEKAANEYVHNIISHAVDTNHFIRKETRRLFEVAKDALDWSSLMPEEVVGDQDIAEKRAQERFDWIFNNPDPDLGYKAFISIGVTNAQFAGALAAIDNPAISFKTPKWSEGILRAMMSVVRQAVQVLAGTSARTEGGSLKDATRALAQATVAINQRNQQRIAETAEGPVGNKINRANAAVVAAVNKRIVEPLGAGLASVQAKRLDPDNPTVPGFLKAATYVALKTRDSEVREEYNKFYRSVAGPNLGKDNSFFEILSEITPWDDTKLNWIDLLRKSKYMVDMARQDATEHTRSFIMDSFDKKNHMTQAHKRAMTKTLLKTDISSLMRGENKLDLEDLARLLNDPNAVTSEITRLEAALRTKLTNEDLIDRYHYFRNQYQSLGNFMRTGKHTVGNPMNNANNIVKQYFLPEVSQKTVTDPEILLLVDSLASLNAMKGQSANDLRLTRDIVNHEMARTDVPGDNGFSRLVGMQINFKELAQETLFKNNPVQMIKGYVYELFDGDVNIKYVQDGSPQQAQALAEGMVLVGALPKDQLDKSPTRYLYKGLKGLNTYNKAVVSLTDLQHRGANLFTTEGFASQAALQKLGDMRSRLFHEALNQKNPDYVRTGNNVVPILNDQGKIVDYRYMMSESNKESIMKMQDPFDRVLPHMFGSLKDRPATVDINRKVVDLLHEEWLGLKDNKEFRFVEIARDSEDTATQEMWRLLPEDMRKYAKDKFGGDKIMIRDDVVNLVLGYRKLSTVNIKDPTGNYANLWGPATPVVKIAEKVWLEIVSLMRIKIAVLTPAVVVGNIASNLAMLLGEGIPPNYIRKNAAEAISGMRQYQKDRKSATELSRRVGAAKALGKGTRQLELKLGRLEADLQANPVGKLVEEGLFTSIAADLGVDDDTIRGSMVQKIEDMASGKAPKAVVTAVKELYMLPGSKGYKAAVAATQYGDFVARYIKVKYDTQVKGVDPDTAIHDALAAFIYYDIPQNKYLQAANDFGPIMFTKFFFRIQSVVARMYSQNPISATSVLLLQRNLLPSPFSENIANYGLGTGLTSKPTLPWNLPAKAYHTLDPTSPAAWAWFTNPLGL